MPGENQGVWETRRDQWRRLEGAAREVDRYGAAISGLRSHTISETLSQKRYKIMNKKLRTTWFFYLNVTVYPGDCPISV